MSITSTATASAAPALGRVGSALPDSLMPAQDSLVLGARMAGTHHSGERRAELHAVSGSGNRLPPQSRPSLLQQRQQIPAFLRQVS